MVGTVKWLSVVAALSAGMGALASWTHGGPREAWAVVQLDGWHAIPMSPPDWSTCYPPSFTQSAFLSTERGDSEAEVRARLGEPFSITWYDDLAKGPSVRFERFNDRWIVASAHGVDVPSGAPMSSLAGGRTLSNEYWSYSRSCTSDQSERIRGLTLRGGSVVRRNAAVIYD
jgi:hypothetical protein